MEDVTYYAIDIYGPWTWHQESDVSGSDALENCPKLIEALDSLRTHRAGALVVSKRDRLGRDVVKMGLLGALVAREGATILSAAGEGEGDDPGAQLMRTLVDAFSAYEVQIIRARTAGALALKKSRGERTGACPYGFRAEPTGPIQVRNGVERRTAMLVPNPAEQLVIARVRTLRSEGFSLAGICQELEAGGFRPRGGRFHPTTIARILAAPATPTH